MFDRLIRFAWRSVWKNRRRTIITGLAVGLGLAALMFTDALMVGMTDHMIDQTTNAWMGDAQIHRDGFRETGRITLTINEPDSITQMLRADSIVDAFTLRIISPASLQSTMELKPVTMIGIDPETEPAVSMLETAVDSGCYFSGDSTDLVIGYKLAEDLDVGLGDLIVITAAEADSGLSSNLFFVTGICHFGSDDLDRYTAFIDINTAESMLGLEGRFHEIAIRLPDSEMGMNESLPFWSRFSICGNKAQGWATLATQVKAMLNMTKMSILITAIILFGLVVFGIVNSLFMSVYERMYEFGVMKAVGTRPGIISIMVILEAFWLAVISMILGSIMGLVIIWITSKTGIDFGNIEVSGVIFDSAIHPALKWSGIWIYPFFTLLLTTAAGVYPGIHAARLNAAEAMRKSL